MKNGMEKPMRQIVRRAQTPRVVKFVLKATACAGALALHEHQGAEQQVNADQATRMYNRIAGMPPTAAELARCSRAASAWRRH